jgi:hypothetical protein
MDELTTRCCTPSAQENHLTSDEMDDAGSKDIPASEQLQRWEEMFHDALEIFSSEKKERILTALAGAPDNLRNLIYFTGLRSLATAYMLNDPDLNA